MYPLDRRIVNPLVRSSLPSESVISVAPDAWPDRDTVPSVRWRTLWVSLAVVAAGAVVAVGCLWILKALDPQFLTPPRYTPQRAAGPAFAVERVIEVEENEEVINVVPRVSLDPRGGYLVADAAEAQIRRYDADGGLTAAFGRKGNGPGEFQHLTAAFRTRDGRIAAAEMSGRLTWFDAAGAEVVRVQSTDVGPLYDAAPMNDSLVLLVGRRAARDELLHVWNRRAERISASFFPVPSHPPELAGAYLFAGAADAAIRGDTIAAVFALTDSVYFFSLDGTLQDRTAIPFRHFRPVRDPMPGGAAPVREFVEWSEGFSSISQVSWTADGNLLVEYFDISDNFPAWRLIHLTRTGHRVFFEARDTPRLLAADPITGSVLLVAPGAEAPNRWARVRLRDGAAAEPPAAGAR